MFLDEPCPTCAEYDPVAEIAAVLCADAQKKKYDHGSQPTLIDFRAPNGFCSRHLTMAQQLFNDVRDPHH